jgi:hypothetical protein
MMFVEIHQCTNGDWTTILFLDIFYKSKKVKDSPNLRFIKLWKFALGPIQGWGSKKGDKNSWLLQSYFLHITFIWNKFKWEKLNNPIYNNSCYDEDFSRADIIVYQILFL